MSEITTTRLTETVSPGLLRSEIDNRITKIRPASTPLDQISRLAGARHAGSMKVEYYSVDIKNGTTQLGTKLMKHTGPKDEPVTMSVKDASLLSESDTIMFPAVKTAAGSPIIGYVTKAENRSVSFLPVNIPVNDEDECSVPAMDAGTLIVRMGRAAGELDVQTPQFVALPTKKDNYCQIFKAQIEESILQKLSDKEVGWTFSDQEEAAILDMRMSMERSFLFGEKNKLTISPDNKEIMLTGGIWHQAEKEFVYSTDSISNTTLISMLRQAFTDSNGSKRKVLIGGSGLIEQLNRLELSHVLIGSQHVTKWGVDFDCIVSKFGTLYVVHSEVFDLCGMDDYGMVIDPEYITKYSHIPFSAERISFHKQGVRNTEAVVLTEASCLVLRYPKAHMRIVPVPKTTTANA
ncbi:MAG: DUF5309 domain-containing protein [Duncaniella sp.]|nr:DUF5309 domain-containing protein [Duncaniella sp.]